MVPYAPEYVPIYHYKEFFIQEAIYFLFYIIIFC